MIQSDLPTSVIIVALLLWLELDLKGGTYEGLKRMHSCTMSQLWAVYFYEFNVWRRVGQSDISMQRVCKNKQKKNLFRDKNLCT